MKKQKNKKSKKSQSEIIVTVLLVLVSIAAVVVLAAWVIPMVKDNSALSNVRVDLSIDKEKTFYNPNVNDPDDQSAPLSRLFVKVTRGPGASELYGIKFILTINGVSESYINTRIPGELESKTYSFAKFDWVKPESIKIAPVVLVNGKQRTLDVIDEVTINEDGSGLIPIDRYDGCSLRIIDSKQAGYADAVPVGCQS